MDKTAEEVQKEIIDKSNICKIKGNDYITFDIFFKRIPEDTILVKNEDGEYNRKLELKLYIKKDDGISVKSIYSNPKEGNEDIIKDLTGIEEQKCKDIIEDDPKDIVEDDSKDIGLESEYIKLVRELFKEHYMENEFSCINFKKNINLYKVKFNYYYLMKYLLIDDICKHYEKYEYLLFEVYRKKYRFKAEMVNLIIAMSFIISKIGCRLIEDSKLNLKYSMNDLDKNLLAKAIINLSKNNTILSKKFKESCKDEKSTIFIAFNKDIENIFQNLENKYKKRKELQEKLKLSDENISYKIDYEFILYIKKNIFQSLVNYYKFIKEDKANKHMTINYNKMEILISKMIDDYVIEEKKQTLKIIKCKKIKDEENKEKITTSKFIEQLIIEKFPDKFKKFKDTIDEDPFKEDDKLLKMDKEEMTSEDRKEIKKNLLDCAIKLSIDKIISEKISIDPKPYTKDKIDDIRKSMLKAIDPCIQKYKDSYLQDNNDLTTSISSISKQITYDTINKDFSCLDSLKRIEIEFEKNFDSYAGLNNFDETQLFLNSIGFSEILDTSNLDKSIRNNLFETAYYSSIVSHLFFEIIYPNNFLELKTLIEVTNSFGSMCNKDCLLKTIRMFDKLRNNDYKKPPIKIEDIPEKILNSTILKFYNKEQTIKKYLEPYFSKFTIDSIWAYISICPFNAELSIYQILSFIKEFNMQILHNISDIFEAIVIKHKNIIINFDGIYIRNSEDIYDEFSNPKKPLISASILFDSSKEMIVPKGYKLAIIKNNRDSKIEFKLIKHDPDCNIFDIPEPQIRDLTVEERCQYPPVYLSFNNTNTIVMNIKIHGYYGMYLFTRPRDIVKNRCLNKYIVLKSDQYVPDNFFYVIHNTYTVPLIYQLTGIKREIKNYLGFSSDGYMYYYNAIVDIFKSSNNLKSIKNKKDKDTIMTKKIEKMQQ